MLTVSVCRQDRVHAEIEKVTAFCVVLRFGSHVQSYACAGQESKGNHLFEAESTTDADL